MKTKIPIEELLRWRLAKAEAEAPPAPRAAQLLESARPWWEIWPEQFRSLMELLSRVQVAYGHAMAESGQSRTAHPVPTLIVRDGEEFQAFASVLYFCIGNGRLRLRFQIDAAHGQSDPVFEATFIAAATTIPLFSARATLSVENEYRLDAELPEKIAAEWEQMKVTDRMPFRLILRTDTKYKEIVANCHRVKSGLVVERNKNSLGSFNLHEFMIAARETTTAYLSI